MQLLEFPIPSLTAAALRMIIYKRPFPFGWPFARGRSLRIIICKRPAPHFDNHKKGMKNAFLRPFTIKKNVFWVSKNQISMKKMSVFLTTSLISTFSLFPCLIPWCFSFTQPWEKSWPIHPCTEATDSFYLTIALLNKSFWWRKTVFSKIMRLKIGIYYRALIQGTL